MSSNADLLNSLRIDRSAPPPPASRKGLWIALAVVATLVLIATAAWLFFTRDQGVVVETATVTATGGNGGAACSFASSSSASFCNRASV